MVQIGSVEDDEKPRFASLKPSQTLSSVTYEEAMDLFKLPKQLGEYKEEEVEANIGRFGPYVRFGKKFVSLDKGEDPLDVTYDRAVELIKAKEKAEEPIYYHNEKGVQKGVGRFGPYLKWDDIFINVNKKYDFDNLSEEDIVELIEDKIQKEKDKLIHDWEEQGIKLEKARWGRFKLSKGKTKVELPKTTDAEGMALDEAEAILAKNTKTKKKTTKKTAAKKPAAKKTTAKKTVVKKKPAKKTTAKKKTSTKKTTKSKPKKS
jgi:DNA topoisomerase-1